MRRLAALSMALAMGGAMGGFAAPVLIPAAFAQTYVGGGSVIVNMQALDQLGPAYGGGANPYSQYPQAYGRPPLPGEAPAEKPLFGDTGAKDAPIKLRPPRAAKAASRSTPASAASTAAASVPQAAAVPQAAPKAAAKPASAPRADIPAASASSGVTINLPPPAAAGSASQSGRPLALPGASPSLLAQPGSVPMPAPQASVSTAPVPPPPTAAPAPTPAVTAPAVAAPAITAMPAPAAPAASASNPASQQTALLTPPSAPAAAGRGGDLVLAFESGKSDLPAGNAQLEALAKQLAGSEDRIQIRAYASASGSDAASGARRLSLSRALAVRSYLIDRGIRSTRIDVRALGVPTDGGAADRVEIATLGR